MKKPISSLAFAGCLFFASIAHASDSLDWANWRGPQQSSVSLEAGLIEEFDPKGGEESNVLWKSEAAGGISSPIVMNGRVYTIVRDSPGTPKDREKVVCLDAETGKVVWENIYNVFLSDLPSERVGWSNLAGDQETGNVYSQGACCYFQCIDGQSGKTIWAQSLSEDYGMLSTYGGRTNTPVVFEDLVIISGVTTGWDQTAKPAHRFFAFNKLSGELVWTNGTRELPEDTTYSTPVIRVINGKTVMMSGSGDGNLYGMEPRTGRILWRQQISRRGVNTSVAVDEQGHVFVGHSEENPEGTAMGAVVCINANLASLESASAELWRIEELMVGKSSPLYLDGRLYVIEDSSALHVLDPETGETIGKRVKLGTAMRGSMVAGDGKIYACTSTGVFHVLKPSEEGIESIFKIRLPSKHDVGGSPAISHGRIFLPTTGGLYCLGISDSKSIGKEQPSQLTASSESAADTELAHLQVIPAESLILPGGKLQFKVVGYDNNGRVLATQPTGLKYEITGPGKIDDQGNLVAASDANHTAVYVKISKGDVVGTARARVIPSLPWEFGFDDHQVPVTWIGARYRHEARDGDNSNPAIVKVSTIPKGTRSQTWFGPSDLHDYTVTANFKADSSTGKLPDMGVIGQRYTLDLMGQSQQLQVRTWAAQLRMARSVPFTWTAGTWYTVKLKASSLDDDTVQVDGKVWKAGEPEPKSWTVTATDPSPNRMGSPGLFGNSTNAEIMIDNVSVKANE